MQEISSPEIRLSDDQTEIAFLWNDFDGDDCFGSFVTQVRQKDRVEEYDFGPCVVWGPRKLIRLVESEGDDSASGGFRNPDIISYELKRTSTTYEFTVEYGADGLRVSHRLESPQIQVNRDFLDEYDGNS